MKASKEHKPGVTPSDIEGKFWIKEDKKIVIKYTKLMLWLHSEGFRIYENEIVKIDNSIISIIEERDLKAHFINRAIEPEMADYFYDKVGGIFSDKGGVMAMLAKLDDSFLRDTKNETWVFFKNYALSITPEAIQTIPYRHIKGYVWESAIINREYYIQDFIGCDAERFVNILGGSAKNKLYKLLGYSMSRFKDPTNPRAVVLTEDIEAKDEGEAQGRSGKGLLFDFIRQFRKVADFDGKSFKHDSVFGYDNVDLDTDFIFIDDVLPSFKFENLFSLITSSFIVKKKNKNSLTIPYSKSPKIAITSNFFVGDNNPSTRARKYDFPVVKYFSEDHTPVDEFGRMFFHDWYTTEWLKFDNFMMFCSQAYLADNNHKDINHITENSLERQLSGKTNIDFINYMDSQLMNYFFDFAPSYLKNFNGEINGVYFSGGVDYKKWKSNIDLGLLKWNKDLLIILDRDILYQKSLDRTKLKTLSTIMVTKWLTSWCKLRGVEVDTRFGNDKVILLKSFPPNNSKEDEQLDLPF